MIAVCMVSKLTHVVPMENKEAGTFLLALNVLFSEVGLPERLYVDAESALLRLHREMVVTAGDKALREHGVGIETVAAHGHSAHRYVERRMKDFGLAMGTLEKTKSGLSKLEVSNIMIVICGKLNNTPYAARFEEVLSTPTGIGQDFNLELVCPNSWRATHKLNRADAAFVTLPLCNSDHQRNVQKHLNGLKLYQQQQLIPLLLMDLKPDHQNNPATIRVGSIVAFFKSGVTKVEKNEKRKLGRVSRIYVSSDSQIRKVEVLYHNPDQLRLVGNKLTGPAYTTTRVVDQLICLDDRKDMADVRDLLEHARRTAGLAGTPIPDVSVENNIPPQNTGSSQLGGNVSQIEDNVGSPDDELTYEPTMLRQRIDDSNHSEHSGDDTPDLDNSDTTWSAPRYISHDIEVDRPITRTRGKRDGIIHTAMLFKYLDN